MQAVFSYGDLGLTYSRSMIFLGCMLGLLARLPTFDRPTIAGSPERASRRPVWDPRTASSAERERPA
jgi:hypothetical protein